MYIIKETYSINKYFVLLYIKNNGKNNSFFLFTYMYIQIIYLPFQTFVILSSIISVLIVVFSMLDDEISNLSFDVVE